MLSPASRTSSNSFFVATIIKKLARSENGLAKIRIPNRTLGYQICGTTEQRLQGLGKSKIVIGILGRWLLFKRDQKIKIAICTETPACGRAEKIKPFYTEPLADTGKRFLY